MWRKCMLPILCLLLAALSAPAAAVPLQTPVQGVLRDNAGVLVQQGSFAVQFALYGAADATEALWTESWPAGGGDCVVEPTGCVQVSKGRFAVELGTHTPLDAALFDGQPRLDVSGSTYVRENLSSTQVEHDCVCMMANYTLKRPGASRTATPSSPLRPRIGSLQ